MYTCVCLSYSQTLVMNLISFSSSHTCQRCVLDPPPSYSVFLYLSFICFCGFSSLLAGGGWGSPCTCFICFVMSLMILVMCVMILVMCVMVPRNSEARWASQSPPQYVTYGFLNPLAVLTTYKTQLIQIPRMARVVVSAEGRSASRGKRNILWTGFCRQERSHYLKAFGKSWCRGILLKFRWEWLLTRREREFLCYSFRRLKFSSECLWKEQFL